MTQEATVMETANILSVADSLSDEAFAAIKSGSTARFRELLDMGLDVDTKDADGFSLLMHAVRENQTEIGRELLIREADPNARNDAGLTALMLASTGNNLEMAKMLLDEITDAELDIGDEYAAEEIALEHGNMEVVNLIRARRRIEEFNRKADDPDRKHHREDKRKMHFGARSSSDDGETLEAQVSHAIEGASAFIGHCAHACADGVKGSWRAFSNFLGHMLHRDPKQIEQTMEALDNATSGGQLEQAVQQAATTLLEQPAPQAPAPKPTSTR